MKNILKCLALSTAFLPLAARAQDKDEAVRIAQHAIALEDAGKMDSVLFLLEKAQKMAPGNPEITYELGYYHVHAKNYDKAIQLFTNVLQLPGGRSARAYQMLGNSYDMKGDSINALNTYKQGMEAFPAAGELYLETGNVYFLRKQYGEALSYYEKGISLNPAYPSNYYRAAQIWTSSDNAVWGMIYGELFMNLERGSYRTDQVSEWLTNTYRQNISIKSKDSVSVTFSKWNVLDISKLQNNKDGAFKMPFGQAYEQTLLLAIIGTDSLSYEGLCTIRSNFIDRWYSMKHDKTYPNVLFSYQQQLKEKGFLNAYNHWLLGLANGAALQAWRTAHGTEWDKFAQWYNDHPLQLTDSNKFVRATQD